jgi:NADPH:quinone reductase-like Zn-dependent oxidoreductase
MKAIVFPVYGSPDGLQLQEIEQKPPQEGRVLVKVHAAAANPLDWHRMRGAPFLVRLEEGFLKPKNPRLGGDFAGRVEAVGSGVTQFKPGDEVFGCATGSFAEYVTIPENAIALKPANLSFEQAAAVPVAALTALQGLREGNIQPGQKVLVNGASGGVGTFAVQIAIAFGAEVTGVCSTRNLEMVRSIGADHVIDYTQADFTRNGQQYDVIYDAIGNRSAAAYKRALKPQGKCIIAGFTTLPRLFEHMLVGAWMSKTGSKKIGLMAMANVNQKDLLVMSEMLAAGKVIPVIDRCYPLSETASAIRYLETGRARGKVIVMPEV